MTVLTPPQRRFTPQPRRWSCAEFHHFGELGAFEGRRAMLIDGVILEEGPMNPPHAITLELVDAALRGVFATGWRIRCQLPIVLGPSTDPHPAFAVVRGSVRDAQGHPTTASLVVEISDTSLDYDTSEKRRLYARAGIPEYWVVDINARRLLVYRDPQDDDYADPKILAPGDRLAPLAEPAGVMSVAELFA